MTEALISAGAAITAQDEATKNTNKYLNQD